MTVDGYAAAGVRVEGSSPSLFVRTDDVRQLRRGDMLTMGEENFWVDRWVLAPDDGGSCHLWLGRGVPLPLTVAAERGMYVHKGLEQAVENLSRISKTAVRCHHNSHKNRVASSAISQSASQVA